MTAKPFREIAAEALADPIRRERIEERKRALDDALALAELRSNRGLSQREIAGALGVSQANISRIEHEEDVYLSTLRRYVAALGGELEINVIFPEGRVALVAAGND